MMQNDHVDIVIVGGGMVGLAMAVMLAQHTPLSIQLLEVKPSLSTWSPSHYHHRVSAFSLASKRIFQALDVWDDMKAKRISPFERIDVWDAAKQGHIVFDSRELAEPLLGYIIENNLIESVLAEKLTQYSQVKVRTGVTLDHLVTHNDSVTLTLHDGSVITAHLAIAADGAHSWLREAAGITMKTLLYHQKGLVTTIKTAKPHQRVARQVFLSTGPLGLLPLQDDDGCSIVWSLPDALADAYRVMPQGEFIEALATASNHCLGDVLSVSERHVFPLAYRHAEQYVKGSIVLAGDAAHTIHPMAGQGINMGLLDAASLLDAILDAKSVLSSETIYRYLRRYERSRKAENDLMLGGVHALKWLFASDAATVQVARSFGLTMTNHLTWIKHIFMKHALGNRKDLPVLAKC